MVSLRMADHALASAWLSAQSWTLPAEISELSDFQWLEHQFIARVFA
jgi:hypothetical protein